jgi:hypothetical protein
MKASHYLSLAVVLMFISAPGARSQNNSAAVRKVILQRYSPQGNLIRFVAASIVQRGDDLGKSTSVVDTSPLHLAGNVEITVFSKTLPSHPTMDDPFVKEMVLTAEEADYNPLTGEIQPQGHVSIRPQK